MSIPQYRFILAVVAVFTLPLPIVRAQVQVPDPDLPMKSVIEAGTMIDAVGNPAVRAYLQRRLEALLAREGSPERNAALSAFLVELRGAVPDSGGHTLPKGDEGATTTNGAAFLVDPARDVELINLLTQYACILQDLEGRGFVAVRRELADNINLAGLSPDAMVLLRQLILVCDEAERALKNTGYIDEDIAGATKSLYMQNLGAYGASSIMAGNPLPLLQAAAAIVKGRYALSKEKDRQMGIEVQNHRGRLANYLFELGVRRSSLRAVAGVGDGVFAGKQDYDRLQEAMAEPDLRKRAALLAHGVEVCPASREALYCLAVVSHEMGEPVEAERHWRDLAARESRLLYHDGLRALAYDHLADYALQRGEISNTVVLARQALGCDPQAAGALNHLALAWLKLGDVPAAYSNVAGALRLDPMNGAYLWTATQVAAVRGDNTLALAFLKAAVNNGFRDAGAIRGCEALRGAMGTPRGRLAVQPPLTTYCNEQLLNHRFAVSNMAGYAVSGMVVRLTVRYETGDRPGREEAFSKRVPLLPAGGLIGFAMAGAPKGQFRCRMELEYQCADYPELTFRSVACHNMEGRGENLEWPEYLQRRALEALKDGSRPRQEEGFRQAVEAAEWTASGDAEILGSCARLAAALGNDEAVTRYSAAARKAMVCRPLLNSVLVEAAVKRLGAVGE
jgi:tetratricopeptide (TPR) repeat protein